MSKIYTAVCYICVMSLCTACFDIDEYLIMKKNGSGSYSIKISMERFLSEIKAYADVHPESVSPAEAEEDENDFTSYDAIIISKKQALAQIKGISKVSASFDTVNYAISMDFEYANLEALNEGLAAAQLFTTIDNTPVPSGFKYFEWKENTLVRHEDPNFKKSFQLPQSKQSPNAVMKGLDMAMFLQDVTYNTHYIFDNAVKSYTHENVQYEKSNTTIVQKIYPFKSSKGAENSLEGVFEFFSKKRGKNQ